jgi:hypothetical protein
VFGSISVTQAFLALLGAKNLRHTSQGGSSTSLRSVDRWLNRLLAPTLAPSTCRDHIRLFEARSCYCMVSMSSLSSSGRSRLRFGGWGQHPVSVVGTTKPITPAHWRDSRGMLRNLPTTATPPKHSVNWFVRYKVKRPRTRYAIVAGRFAYWTVPTSLPNRWLDRLVVRGLGFTQAAE